MTIAFKFLLRMIFITFGNISGTELEKIQVCLMCFDLMLGRRENLNFKFPQRQASSPGVVAHSILRSGRHQALALLLIQSCAAAGIKPWRCCSFNLAQRQASSLGVAAHSSLRSGRHQALALLLFKFAQRQASGLGVVAHFMLRSGKHQTLALLLNASYETRQCGHRALE